MTTFSVIRGRRGKILRLSVTILVIVLILPVLYTRVFDRALVTKSAHLDAEADFSKNDLLVSAAKDIFFGTVVRKLSEVSRNADLPETQFVVRVDKSLLGDAAGVTVVNQLGGYTIGGLVLQLFEGDPLLEPGKSYLLFTTDYETESGKNGWRSLFFPGFTKIEVRSADAERALEREFERYL